MNTITTDVEKAAAVVEADAEALVKHIEDFFEHLFHHTPKEKHDILAQNKASLVAFVNAPAATPAPSPAATAEPVADAAAGQPAAESAPAAESTAASPAPAPAAGE